jgi:hypothetical protein
MEAFLQEKKELGTAKAKPSEEEEKQLRKKAKNYGIAVIREDLVNDMEVDVDLFEIQWKLQYVENYLQKKTGKEKALEENETESVPSAVVPVPPKEQGIQEPIVEDIDDDIDGIPMSEMDHQHVEELEEDIDGVPIQPEDDADIDGVTYDEDIDGVAFEDEAIE